MKKVLNVLWDFLEAYGEHRYKLAKKRGYGMY